jgi:SAM-dependent methyltransferase
VKKKLKAMTGFRLDVGCGGNKQLGFIGMDKRQVKGPDGKDIVDVLHDIEIFPWPFKDETVLDILCSHIIEHIKPWLMIDLFNEMWRVMKPGGQLVISMPYGVSYGFVQDPTHCNACNEATFQYFDPRFPLYGIYKPKPWLTSKGFPAWQPNGNMEVLMRKVTEADGVRIGKGEEPVDNPIPVESKKVHIEQALIRQGYQKGAKS